MALVTTLMTGPLMRVIDPIGSFGSPPGEELAAAPRLVVGETAPPARAILVAPQSDAALDHLLALSAPLARREPPRKLIITRLIPPPRGSTVRGGLQTGAHLVQEAFDRVQRARLGLLDRGIAARAVALPSAKPGGDLVNLSQEPGVDLALLDGRRPLLGDVSRAKMSARC